MKKVSFGSRPPATAPQAVSPEDWVADRDKSPEPIKRLTIDLPLSLHRRVKTGCVQEDVAIADVVREFLDHIPIKSHAQKYDDTESHNGGKS